MHIPTMILSVTLALKCADMLSSSGLQVSVDSMSGNYTLRIDGEDWLVSTPPRYLPSMPLELASSSRSNGTDRLGSFDSIAIDWATSNRSVLRTTFRAYQGDQVTTKRRE